MDVTDVQSADRELWWLLKKGDKEAFAILFERYHRTLYNYGIKLAPASPGVVEDAIQDLFVDLWRLRDGLTDSVDSVKFYLYRSLRRKIHLSQKKEPLQNLEERYNDHHLPFQTSHESQVIQEESFTLQKERLKELLNQLPERQLEALTLKYFENFSTEEIAGMMDVNEKSVRNFLYKALITLRANRHWLVFSALTMSSLLY